MTPIRRIVVLQLAGLLWLAGRPDPTASFSRPKPAIHSPMDEPDLHKTIQRPSDLLRCQAT